MYIIYIYFKIIRNIVFILQHLDEGKTAQYSQRSAVRPTPIDLHLWRIHKERKKWMLAVNRSVRSSERIQLQNRSINSWQSCFPPLQYLALGRLREKTAIPAALDEAVTSSIYPLYSCAYKSSAGFKGYSISCDVYFVI